MDKIYKLWLINFIAPIILILTAAFLQNAGIHETYRYINGELFTWRRYVSLAFLGFSVIFAVMFVIETVLLVKLKKVSLGKIILSAALLLFSLPAMLFSAVGIGGIGNRYDTDYYEFSHEGRTIVICEEAYLLGGWGEIYRINEDRTADKIGSFGTDDGHKNGGDYEIEWFDNHALIHYYDGNDMRCLEIELK